MTSILYGAYHAGIVATILFAAACIAASIGAEDAEDYELGIAVLLLGSVMAACALFW
jgi:hypothetical protein